MSDHEQRQPPKGTVHPIRKKFRDFVDDGVRVSPPGFGEVRQLLAAHRASNRDGGAHLFLIREIEYRAAQLEWILNQVERAETAIQHSDLKGYLLLIADYQDIVDDGLAPTATDLEITTLCSAFYSIAWQLIGVASRIGLEIKADCVSVNRARNHLLEHTEKHITRGWSFVFGKGASKGPVLRPLGVSKETAEPKQRYVDPGLYANAHELVGALSKRLRELAEVS